MRKIVCLFSIFWMSGVLADFDESAKTEMEKPSEYSCVQGLKCFQLSDNFPVSMPTAENYPWNSIDFENSPKEYMQAVLGYVLEGNIEVDWNVANNPIRKWYHAPWMHAGNRGREPINGLTRERGSRWHELSTTQTRRTNNWAVGFYNPPGGYTFGQVWKDPSNPDTKKSQFPVGTVSAKLLFTDATDEEAPFLKSDAAFYWNAQIDRNGVPIVMRLLQLDIAVRDSNADHLTGWLFGTFIFDGSQEKSNYWENIIPVGLQWGNDPDFTSVDYSNGQRPKEGWINPYVAQLFYQRPPTGDFGLYGRMNGPVDNPLSSCLACHGRAVDTRGERGPAFTPLISDLCINRVSIEGNETYKPIPGCTVNETAVKVFFRNLKPNEPFLPNTIPLDYSLQMADGVANWHRWFKDMYPDLYLQKYPPATSPLMQGLLPMTAEMQRVYPNAFNFEAVPNPIPTLPAEKAFSRGDEDL